MPRKQKQKQKQSQRQTVVVNVAAPRKRKSSGRRRKGGEKALQEAEYIAALNRTMPAVQINPPPASQVPMLSQEQAVGLLQSALAMRPPAAEGMSLAQKDVQRRDAAVRMQREFTRPRRVNLNEVPESLADNEDVQNALGALRMTTSRLKGLGLEGSNFSFSPTPDLVPSGMPDVPFDQPIPLAGSPIMQDTVDIVSEPSSNIRMNVMDEPNDVGISPGRLSLLNPKPIATLPQPLDQPDADLRFAYITTPRTPRETFTGGKAILRRNKKTGDISMMERPGGASPRMMQREEEAPKVNF